MRHSPGSPEFEDIQQLLAEVRRTLCDNQLFLKKLKDDDADMNAEEVPSLSVDGPEENFEEL